ncbi:hypothetical protein J2Y45_004806 [Dyadobacter sp. BE34]|uniref:VapC45 PIN like domain-containing protein n=1 Tax=Dyadobacter fermentans TaxID=94254 RepID=A0ABU1R2F3_9BACT|nr:MULTISPECIES: hypothetical protein [Dyadobacter]MDR6807606.1 hypothetical protein [Dyadobacter fermentans]MDR7045347.1 hypothetical protein [Dyadobacter sp. BE242]MDR7199660.1 hypothetical protein [Dyadobacter sp. BE34]MDR7217881.1 hypothetical protein [Dyadobacter sp. BE31]MDR7265551.1 hypothetical protein [Dyadobacter sp. BE32]
MTKIYIDENLPLNIAEGLNILEAPNRDGFEVLSIKKVFGSGTADEDWLAKIGRENAVVITQDFNIHRNHYQRALYQQHNVGVFFISPPSKTGYQYWEMVEQIIKRWRDIKKHCKSQRPFAFRCTSRSTDFERL